MVGCLRIADLILCGGIGILGGFHGCVSVVGTLNGLTWWICGVDVCIFGALLDGEFLEFVFMGCSS